MVHPLDISIYTSTGSISLEGEGWDEGDIKGCFYSSPPSRQLLLRCSTSCILAVVQQEGELRCFVTHCIYNEKSYVDTYALWVKAWKLITF